jgi:pimeloyl-ACP methyl ester carboxylesterase
MKSKLIFILLGATLCLASCKKVKSKLSVNADDTFYVESNGASMRVKVHGNTTSKVILLVAHGGPGFGAIAYRPALENIEKQYGVAYWDQRAAGFSQGGNNIENLKMEQQGKDAKAVLLVLKLKYPEFTFFIYGQSWGGMVSSSFMTQNNNQSMVKGWIFANATHDYFRNDELTMSMMLDSSVLEIARGNSVKEWKEIQDFCNKTTPSLEVEVSQEINKMARTAQGLYNYKIKPNSGSILSDLTDVESNTPGSAILPDLLNNFLYKPFAAEIIATSFTSRLNIVTTPTLVLSGAYDFVCPYQLNKEFFNSLGSVEKKHVIFYNSRHGMEENDAYQAEIASFIEQYK